MSWFAWDPHNFLPSVAATVALHLIGRSSVWIFKIRERNVAHALVYFTITALALLTYILGGADHPRKTVATVLTAVFCLRLGGFVIYRSLDKYPGKKFSARAWIIFFIAPLVWGLPIIFCNSPPAPRGTSGPFEIIGGSVATLGFIIEAIADHQKSAFRKDPRNNGKWCSVGLYKYSRYPNYFGDVIFWWGVFLVCLPALGGLRWIAILSPIWEMLILLKIDGVPKLEKTHDDRYGKNPGYIEYKNSTSTFIPCPPWLYRRL